MLEVSLGKMNSACGRDSSSWMLHINFNSLIFMQFCEYGPEPAKCYEWMKENLPEYYARLVGGGKPKVTIKFT